ncbi:hypothetical protein V1264_014933 [Littorina saxatilis]|uniref:CCHC-type domain-containing protein n=1 Tax=Littorina saxatilis TaxID=31220 RepID=A0AAN9BKR0_9CAEN
MASDGQELSSRTDVCDREGMTPRMLGRGRGTPLARGLYTTPGSITSDSGLFMPTSTPEVIPTASGAPIIVHVKAPTQSPRLGIFTGTKPGGGAEVNFNDWKERVEQFLEEEREEGTRLSRVRASLRGLAKVQTKQCTTGGDILSTLQSIYGATKTVEDLYLEFVQMSATKSETPADFLTRLWAKFSEVNRDNQYTRDETQRKVYHLFMTQLNQRQPMLALELRNLHGLPGVASPDLAHVLRRVRELEAPGVAVKATTAAVGVASPQPEIDYEKLSTMVAQKLQASSLVSDIRQPHPQRDSPNPQMRGACYVCKEFGHYARQCPNRRRDNRSEQLNYLQSGTRGSR